MNLFIVLFKQNFKRLLLNFAFIACFLVFVFVAAECGTPQDAFIQVSLSVIILHESIYYLWSCNVGHYYSGLDDR